MLADKSKRYLRRFASLQSLWYTAALLVVKAVQILEILFGFA